MTDFEAVRAVSLWGPWATVAILVAVLGLATLVGAALRSMRAHGTTAQEVDSESVIEVAGNPEDLSPEDRDGHSNACAPMALRERSARPR